jgi:hypothetical protein
VTVIPTARENKNGKTEEQERAHSENGELSQKMFFHLKVYIGILYTISYPPNPLYSVEGERRGKGGSKNPFRHVNAARKEGS